MVTINIKNSSSKKCALCKYWYDVTNSVIKPKSLQIGVCNMIQILKRCA
ncbi:MAG: hypothetical protein SOY42_05610 [Clostridium sp.]|nr:hypothetical protein [Clostridium sp.]